MAKTVAQELADMQNRKPVTPPASAGSTPAAQNPVVKNTPAVPVQSKNTTTPVSTNKPTTAKPVATTHTTASKIAVPKPRVPAQSSPIPESYSPVVVTKRVLLQMASHVVEHPTIETAFDLLGLICLGEGDREDTAIVTTVVPPSPLNIVRGYANVSLGGADQAKATSWFLENAKVLKTNGALRGEFHPAYLHVGHSHHELDFEFYSGTDISTIRNMVKQVGLRVAVGPLLNIKSHEPMVSQRYLMTPVPKVEVRWNVKVDIKFYLYTKKMAQRGITDPIIVRPTIVEEMGLPPVPPLSWRYTMPEHFMEQVRHLRALGCDVAIQEREIVAGPPFETQLVLTNTRWQPGTMVSIVTKWNFPVSAPEFKIIKPGVMPYTVTLPAWEEKMDFIDVLLPLLSEGSL